MAGWQYGRTGGWTLLWLGVISKGESDDDAAGRLQCYGGVVRSRAESIQKWLALSPVLVFRIEKEEKQQHGLQTTYLIQIEI